MRFNIAFIFSRIVTAAPGVRGEEWENKSLELVSRRDQGPVWHGMGVHTLPRLPFSPD